MKCQICKKGETRSSTTTVTLERDESTLVFKHVPAEVCEVCGESYVDEGTTSELLEQVRSATDQGVEVDVRDWQRAAS